MKKTFKYSKFRSCKWVFTVNNFHQGPLKDWPEIFAQGNNPVTHKALKYLAVAHEVGSSGTPHLQGYIHFTQSVRGSTVAKIIAWSETGAFIEPARTVNAADYPGREDKGGEVIGVWTIGDRGSLGQGKDVGRSNMNNMLLQAKEAIDSGATEDDLWQNFFIAMVRHERALLRYMDAISRKRQRAAISEAIEGEKITPLKLSRTMSLLSVSGELLNYEKGRNANAN